MLSVAKYKYQAVANDLRRRLGAGEFLDGRLPGEDELIARYGVGKITAYNAVKELVKSGQALRVKGKGTFVNDGSYAHGACGVVSRQVAVIAQAPGMYQGMLFERLSLQLLERGFFPVTARLSDFAGGRLSDSAVTGLFNSGIKNAIVFGESYWKRRFLDGHDAVNRVFIGYFDADGGPPGGLAVLVDYESGVYQATLSLGRSGRRRIALFRHPNTVRIEMTASHKRNHPLFQAEAGYRRAIRELGQDEELICQFPWGRQERLACLAHLFEPARRPDGIVCLQDSVAVSVMIQAMTSGSRVPDDLAIIGFYNTYWCDEAPVPLSSVSTRPELIAEKAVEALISSKDVGVLTIKPELLVRESSKARDGYADVG